MFDLDREVASWSATLQGERCHDAARVAELTDHLYCEIDRARAEGRSDEEAFRTAVARLGSVTELTAEHAKNRSAVCRVAAKIEPPLQYPGHRGPLIAHAFIWASLILASSVMFSKSEAPNLYGYLLTGVCVPLWWVSDRLPRSALRRRTAR
jgi:hypothetical protein